MTAAKPKIVKIVHIMKMKAVVSPLLDTISVKFQRLYLFGVRQFIGTSGNTLLSNRKGKCKMAATKFQMYVSPLPDKRYQRNSDGFMFWGPAFQRD